MAERKNSFRRAAEAERTRNAVRLRIARMSYAQIAEQCGFSDESGARKAVDRALTLTRAQTTERAEELKQLDLAKLDELELRLTHVVRKKESTPRELSDATRAMLGVMKRRADLLGLDAALKVEHSGVVADGKSGSALAAAMTDAELEALDRVYTAAAARIGTSANVPMLAIGPVIDLTIEPTIEPKESTGDSDSDDGLR